MLIQEKKNTFFIISIILICVLGYSTVNNLSTYTENPFNRVMNFIQPIFAASDGSSNIYIIDNGMKRVVKVNNSGKALFTLHGGKESTKGFYYALELDTDSSGNIYILNNILDANGQYVEREEIIRYTSGGKFKDIIYSIQYESEERPLRTGNLSSITVNDENIYCYNKQKDSFTHIKISLKTKIAKTIKTIDFSDAGSMIVDFATSNDSMESFFATKRGEIYRSDSHGDVSLVYSGNDKSSDFAVSIPWEVEIDSKGVLYFSDLLQKSIISIDNSGKQKTVLSDGVLKEQGYNGENASFYRISVGMDGNLVSVCNENVVSYKNSSIAFFDSGSLFPTGLYLLRFLIWLQLLVFLCLVVYVMRIVLRRLLKGGASLVFLQSIFVIAVIIICTIIVSSMIFNSFQGRYEKEVFNRISQTLYLAAKSIDGDTFEKIKKPEHFMNEDYKRVREQLHGSFNYNQDSWNEGFYGALYTVVDDKLYAVMYYDDSKCPYYPLSEDGSEKDYIRAFKEKTMITTKSSDSEGDWMYGMEPVFNSSGKVVGVIEVGTDLYGFKQENEKLKNNILLETVTLLVVLVFVMIEITIFADFIRRRKSSPRPCPTKNVVTSMDTLMIRPICFIIYAASFLSGSFVPILMKKLYEPIWGLPENLVLALPISAEALFLAVSSVIGGYVLDRKGWKTTFIAGLSLLFAGQLMSGFASSAMWFILARSVSGMGMGLSFISMQNYVVIPSSEEERNEGISALNSGGFAGLNAGLIVGGMLAERVGFSNVFFFSAVLVVICTLMTIKGTKNAVNTEDKIKSAGSLRSLANFFSSFSVLTFFLMILLPTVICTMFIDYFFPLFAENAQMSTSDISRAFLLNGLSIIYLGPVLSGYLSKKIGVRLSMLLAGLIMAGGLLQFALQGTITSALIAILLIGIAESFGITMRINYFSSKDAVVELGHGKALGYYGLVENSGQVLGPIIYGIVIGLGIFKGIGLMGLCLVGMILFFSVISLKKRIVVKELSANSTKM